MSPSPVSVNIPELHPGKREITEIAFLVPCCVLYFSFWYRPRERALRLAVFHASNALAGAVSAFFAAGIDHVSTGLSGSERETEFLA